MLNIHNVNKSFSKFAIMPSQSRFRTKKKTEESSKNQGNKELSCWKKLVLCCKEWETRRRKWQNDIPETACLRFYSIYEEYEKTIKTNRKQAQILKRLSLLHDQNKTQLLVVGTGLRQGFALPPILFIIYIFKVQRQPQPCWTTGDSPRISSGPQKVP